MKALHMRLMTGCVAEGQDYAQTFEHTHVHAVKIESGLPGPLVGRQGSFTHSHEDDC